MFAKARQTRVKTPKASLRTSCFEVESFSRLIDVASLVPIYHANDAFNGVAGRVQLRNDELIHNFARVV